MSLQESPASQGTQREIEAIRRLAQDRQAIILAHYYCRPEVQDAADYVGDSLGLSRTAAESPAKVIAFCGVHFMAETASILCPDKTVLAVNPEAGCPMADMISAEALADRQAELPGVQVLTYVNSPAEVKALSDMCCTSANVVDILGEMAGDSVLMTPDKNLAAFAQKRVPGKKVLFWEGYCPIHHQRTAEEVQALKAHYPEARVAAHPECRPEVLELADFVGSTTAILNYVKNGPDREFIVITEEGVAHQLRDSGKICHFPPEMICEDMKKNTLADLRRALETLSPEVRVSDEIRARALAPIEKMLQRG